MRLRLMLALAALVVASPAAAEVSDKQPSLAVVWAWALAFNVAAFLLARVRPWLGLVVLPISVLFAWATHSEISDPHVGPSILQELGPAYVNLSYLSAIVGILGPITIVLLSSRARRQRS